MIQYISGDIFQSSMQTLVNPVNTVGVMGKGLAKEFANRYPEMLGPYKALCQAGTGLMPGQPWLYKSVSRWIYNFPTKNHWSNPSELQFIDWGLARFVRTHNSLGITGIAFPKLGCGLGGLYWPDVKELFDEYLDSISIPVEVYI